MHRQTGKKLIQMYRDRRPPQRSRSPSLSLSVSVALRKFLCVSLKKNSTRGRGVVELGMVAMDPSPQQPTNVYKALRNFLISAVLLEPLETDSHSKQPLEIISILVGGTSLIAILFFSPLAFSFHDWGVCCFSAPPLFPKSPCSHLLFCLFFPWEVAWSPFVTLLQLFPVVLCTINGCKSLESYIGISMTVANSNLRLSPIPCRSCSCDGIVNVSFVLFSIIEFRGERPAGDAGDSV